MAPFRSYDDNELSRLSDEELIAYHHQAREAGRPEDAMRAMAHLLDRYRDRVRFWVQRKVAPQDVEDVISDITESTLTSILDGESEGEWVVWLRTITFRRIADHHDRLDRKQSRDQALPEEHEAREEIWGKAGEVPDHAEELLDRAEDPQVRALAQRALGEMNPVHRRVVELGGKSDLGFEQGRAKDVAAEINDQFGDQLGDPMTDVNVHQILSRFTRSLAELYRGWKQGRDDG